MHARINEPYWKQCKNNAGGTVTIVVHRPYSLMAAVSFFFFYCAKELTKPHINARILFNLAHANEA